MHEAARERENIMKDKKAIECVLTMREKYAENKAQAVADDLMQLHQSLVPLFERWCDDPGDQGDFAAEGLSLKALCDKLKMNYAAALLTMDWVIKEPAVAVPAIKSRFRV